MTTVFVLVIVSSLGSGPASTEHENFLGIYRHEWSCRQEAERMRRELTMPYQRLECREEIVQP